ncbi:Acetyl esterase/lipase [Gracilibacillus ureilyticus]|uniref:Acetyl esterase/lipase n=1 Tax=Gracilibacillus ureilyticus TaxID=531814 RepID=A0A1H9VVF2_9BACI|nr:alpha/beta hydrolase [Gracilibacillus ureilyticus]SES25474.1 Acetyl esterase/lipase [Gracilibacillus ureilyticus]
MKEFYFDFPVTEKVYKTVHRDLKLYIFEPDKDKHDRPAILFFNGGSFLKNPKTPDQFQHQAAYLASKGMVSICVDYRNGSDERFLPTQAIADVKSAVRWVRKNATELGIDQSKIVICGSSAGGYITVSSIMFDELNDDPDYSNQNKDHIPSYAIIFAAGMDGVDIMRRRYPELLGRAEELSPILHVPKKFPQTLWICGTGDDLYDQNSDFIQRMNNAGNKIRLKTYEGMEHGFFNYGKHNNKYYQLTLEEMDRYLQELQLI